MRQILLFAALAASLALLSGCALSKAKEDKAEDMTGKATYQKISTEEAYHNCTDILYLHSQTVPEG